MEIGIWADRNDFFYDIHSLVKSFFPDEDVRIFCDEDQEQCSRSWNLLLRVEIPEYGTGRKEARDTLKRELYLLLSAYTGQTLPWGILSGIRPAKIPMGMLKGGASKEECVRHLMEADFVSEEKARLATEVASLERELTAGIDTGSSSWSLYVHLPFCPSICLYCTFASNPESMWKKRGDRYLEALQREMRDGRTRMEAEGRPASPTTVYIGGGTPTTLSEAELDRLLTMTEECFALTGALEYTVEAGRPDSITPEKLRVLRAHGVNRISVNPQTMNRETLERIGRRHTPEDTKRAFYLAREAGFESINMDMILGLPGEGEEQAEHTLREIEALDPDSLTVHSLAIKRASRLRREVLEDRLKDQEADRGDFRGLSLTNSAALMQRAAGSALRMGMRPYYLYRQKNMRGNLENTGFSRPGRECLYNILIMEEMQSIAAFGAGASSKTVYPDGRIERSVTTRDLDLYFSRVFT